MHPCHHRVAMQSPRTSATIPRPTAARQNVEIPMPKLRGVWGAEGSRDIGVLVLGSPGPCSRMTMLFYLLDVGFQKLQCNIYGNRGGPRVFEAPW